MDGSSSEDSGSVISVSEAFPATDPLRRAGAHLPPLTRVDDADIEGVDAVCTATGGIAAVGNDTVTDDGPDAVSGDGTDPDTGDGKVVGSGVSNLVSAVNAVGALLRQILPVLKSLEHALTRGKETEKHNDGCDECDGSDGSDGDCDDGDADTGCLQWIRDLVFHFFFRDSDVPTSPMSPEDFKKETAADE